MIAVKPEGFTLTSRNGGVCSICGAGHQSSVSAERLTVITLGVHIEMEGFFDICAGCAKIIGEVVGMVPSKSYLLLGAEYDELTRDLKEMQAKLQNKEDAISLLAAELASASHRGVYGSMAIAPLPKKSTKKKAEPKAKKPIQEGL